MAMEVSHIWLGRFGSQEALAAYFESSYDHEDEAMNRLAVDQGEAFYDTDWVELTFEPGQELRDLVHGHSYSERYLEQVLELARQAGLQGVDTFVLADVAEFETPRSIARDGFALWYLGRFQCRA